MENCKSEENVCGTATLPLEAGRSYKLEIPVNLHVGMPIYPVRLTAVPGGVGAADVKDEELFAAAREADAVLFFGGLNHTFDAEGSDRKDMALHDGQNELISALAKINPRIAVVLVGGSPMEMPWIDEVPAVVQMWYAGMEAGNAIADVLFGRVNPSGKLPFTFPKRLADSPAHALDDYQPLICHYAEDLLMGYRWFDTKQIEPLFPFGHGLSYTAFEYGGADGRDGRRRGGSPDETRQRRQPFRPGDRPALHRAAEVGVLASGAGAEGVRQGRAGARREPGGGDSPERAELCDLPSGQTGVVRRAGPLPSPPRREFTGHSPGDRGRTLNS
ncbi:MAG: glycoside hydrolase family 3 C-terminal domain-containing protein [Lentisphaeria bacterium]|nr:MAG: glycoside hydrolase family 3 C-terminal domain-containing protein [Lentisphaeria bacterium]